MVSPDILDEEAGGSSSRDCGEGGYKVSSFSHRIYHYHNGVVACRLREFYNEVHADGVPWCVRDW